MLATEMKKGQKAMVRSFGRGRGMERRLFEMGIMPGTEIELLEKHPFKGPLLFQVGQARIVLGRNIAAHLEVEITEISLPSHFGS
ncbi:MAG TPA: FeoA family protein [Syntrophomonas sp.]|jgi:ferrous iron transport protein A|nr:FeoA family protein [Syntrophomonas sp.]HRW11805.1 FeoA family protein [Syntrophomonas sp.]